MRAECCTGPEHSEVRSGMVCLAAQQGQSGHGDAGARGPRQTGQAVQGGCLETAGSDSLASEMSEKESTVPSR